MTTGVHHTRVAASEFVTGFFLNRERINIASQ